MTFSLQTILVGFGLVLSIPAQAADTTWTGNGSDNSWNTSGNWSSNVPNSSGTATFNINLKTAISVDSPATIRDVLFDTANAGAFTIAGTSALTLFNAGSISISSTVINTETFNAPLLLSSTNNSTFTFANNSSTNGVSLTFGGTITGMQAAMHTTNLILNGTNNGSVTGDISDGTSGGNVQITMSGSGTWTLSGSNGYSGGTTVSSGLLAAGSDTAFGNGTLNLFGGGVQAVTGSRSLSNAIILNASSGVTVSGGQDLTFSGPVTQTTNDSIVINNITAGKALTLSGDVYLSNATSVQHTLTINGTGATAIVGVVSDFNGTTSKHNGLVKSGAGSLTLSGANTYTGTTNITGGALLVDNTSGSGTGSGAVTVSNAGTILGGTGTITGPVTVNGSAKLLGGDGTTGTTLMLSGAVTLQDASIIQLALGSIGTHSTLAGTGGTWTFDNDQAFNFIDLGAAPGAYDNIITGLTSDPGTTGSWTIDNPGWSGIFTYDGANIDFTLTAVPEPSTWAAGALTLLALCYTQRRRFSFARSRRLRCTSSDLRSLTSVL